MFTFKIECLVFPSSVPQFVISVLVPLFKLSWEQFLQQRHLLCSCSWETTGFQYCISVTCRSVFFLRVLIRSKMFSIGKNFSKKKKKTFFLLILERLGNISKIILSVFMYFFLLAKFWFCFSFFIVDQLHSWVAGSMGGSENQHTQLLQVWRWNRIWLQRLYLPE